MCGCGRCGHGHGHSHDCGYPAGGGYGPIGVYGRSFVTGCGTTDEAMDELQEYKESLEAEIRRLEKRMGLLRPKPTSE
jgi:hypothetical protein